jgi:penicillin-binding protein 2
MTTPKRIQHPYALRITLIQLTILAVFVLFGFRLWRLQVVAGAEYRELAKRNRTRLITTDAARGVIYDRTNEILVRNVPRFDVLLIPAYLPKEDDAKQIVLDRLQKLLDLPMVSDYAPPSFPPYSGVAKLGLLDMVREGSLYAPYTPIVLKENVSQEIAFVIEEEHLDLPGVLIQIDPYREYPTGSLTAHLLGYMGPIPAWAYQEYGQERGYDADDNIGRTGLESSYEDLLRGKKGTKTIEVDVAGREVRPVGRIVPPELGHNLILTLDLDLQRYVQEVLSDGMARVGSTSAVAIVTQVETGQVLSMVSLPSFDNNLFAQGISQKEFVKLNTDPDHPLVNHATSGQYPPGSVFKLVPASGGLQEQVITRWTQLTCPPNSGILWLPNKYYPNDPQLARPFYCWTHSLNYGHGNIAFVNALANSCDIYFYLVGGGLLDRFEGLGLERLRLYANAFGYGEPTGIDLPAETPGLIPGEKWKRINYSERWTTGDTYNMSIGQGFVLATPLQVANATAAVANGGTLYQPQLVYQVHDAEGNVVQDFEKKVIRELPVSEENLALVREGMRAAVERGTAQWIQVKGGLQVAAKTGTAEFCEKYPDCVDENDRIITTHAWFTCFAPFDDPEIAITVFVYGGGEGAAAAMPVAAEILNYYFQLY